MSPQFVLLNTCYELNEVITFSLNLTNSSILIKLIYHLAVQRDNKHDPLMVWFPLEIAED